MSVTVHCVLVLASLLLCCQCAVTDDADWIDPYDMENFDPSSNSMKDKFTRDEKQAPNSEKTVSHTKKEDPVTSTGTKETMEKTQAGPLKRDNPQTCRQPNSPCVALFRQYVRSLLYHIRGKVFSGVEDLNLRLKATPADVEFLERYSDPSGSEEDFHHVHEILTTMLQFASEVSHGDPSLQRFWLETLTGMPVEKFFMFVILAGVLTFTFWAAAKYHFSWWKLSTRLIFFLFVISVFLQWYELYKKEEAKQHMTIMNEMPEGCRRREKDESFMRTVIRSLTSSFTFEKDECLQYYEHMLIDPFWKVTPTQALSKTLIRFFVAPMRDLGEALREFFIGLLKDLPAQLWPVVLAFVGIFSFLLLFMYFGYRVSLPFGLIAVEPGPRQDNSQAERAIMQQNEELKALKNAQESQIKQIMDILKEERQARQKQLENQEKVLSLPSVQSSLKALQSGDQKSDWTFPPVGAIESGHVSLESEVSLESGKAYMKSGGECPADIETLEAVQEVSQDEKGNGFSMKNSDTESFEEISVSNIEADTVGHKDN